MSQPIDIKKADIKNMELEELSDFLTAMGEKPYRARQIYSWIHRGVRDFSEMTDLSKGLRDSLEKGAELRSLEIQRVQRSSKDGTRKYLFGLPDGNAIESVFMKYQYGNSVCLSSQAGCRMGCQFCASGKAGLSRNLTAGEILDQFLCIQRDTGEKAGHIVLMGTGEPLDNYEEVSRFLRMVHRKEGLNLGLRNITVSTCGIVPMIRRFGEEFPQVNLAISLHASNDKDRSSLMPVNRSYPLAELLSACSAHAKQTGRRITFEYALVKNVNDRPENGKELAALLSGMLCHVNLIPLNAVASTGLSGTDRKAAQQFREALERRGIPATVRRELGGEIEAACGQLRLTEKSTPPADS